MQGCQLLLGSDLEPGGDVKVLLHVCAQHLVDGHQPQLHIHVIGNAIGGQLQHSQTEMSQQLH